MCQWSSGCGTNTTINCKNCGTSMCSTCKRNSGDGTPVRSGNAGACGKCGKNFRSFRKSWLPDFFKRKKEVIVKSLFNL